RRRRFHAHAAVHFEDPDVVDSRRRPAARHRRRVSRTDESLATAPGGDEDEGQQINGAETGVHKTCCFGCTRIARRGFSLNSSQTRLLRIAAFLVDAITMALVLILPAPRISHGMSWSRSPRGIQAKRWLALGVVNMSNL